MLCAQQRDARPAAHPITSLSQPRAQPCLPLAPLGAGQLLLLRRIVGVTWSLILAPLGAGQLLLLRRIVGANWSLIVTGECVCFVSLRSDESKLETQNSGS